MVSFILGNSLARSTSRVFHYIERRREDAADDPSAKESLDLLREEEHVLRVAYREFCELVIAGLIDNKSPFIEPIAEAARAAFSNEGTEWLKIDYLWSRAAREAYNTWNQKRDEEE